MKAADTLKVPDFGLAKALEQQLLRDVSVIGTWLTSPVSPGYAFGSLLLSERSAIRVGDFLMRQTTSSRNVARLSSLRIPRVVGGALLGAVVVTMACSGGTNPASPSGGAAAGGLAPVSAGDPSTVLAVQGNRNGANTALVCHLRGNGTFAPLYVSPRAVPGPRGPRGWASG